jgi:hypothetical protein
VDLLVALARELRERDVRFVVIGVAGANYYALDAGTLFATEDRDLLLPLDPGNLVQCWSACDALGYELWSETDPLDRPRDGLLAERVVERRALTRARHADARFDLTLVMQGFDFETVWQERRTFTVDDVDIPVARLLHIVESKHAAGRDKDRLFLAAHREALQELMRRESRD